MISNGTRGKVNKKRVFVFPQEKNFSSFRVYEIHFKKSLSRETAANQTQILASKLFYDPVCEFFNTHHASRMTRNCYIVWLKDGVYDAEGEMALYVAQKLGLARHIQYIRFGKGYLSESSGIYNPLVETMEKLS